MLLQVYILSDLHRSTRRIFRPEWLGSDGVEARDPVLRDRSSERWSVGPRGIDGSGSSSRAGDVHEVLDKTHLRLLMECSVMPKGKLAAL